MSNLDRAGGRLDEAEAIERLRRGDIAGLELLVRRYQTTALRAAQLVTRDRSLAEDIVQAAFIRAYEHIGQFDPARPFGPWFVRSVVNAALQATARESRWKVGGREPEVDAVALLDALQDPGTGPEAALDAAETCAELRTALNRLAPAQRAAVVLRYYLDLNEAEMVAHLASPRGTIKRRLHDARLRLRTLLGATVRPAGSGPGGVA